MNKPAFDPNQPFETVDSAKPAFDPSQPFEPGDAVDQSTTQSPPDVTKNPLFESNPTFRQDASYPPEATNPVEQRLVQNFSTAMGGAGIGQLAGTVGMAATTIPQYGFIKGLSAAMGPSADAIKARMANPDLIKNAPSYAELADQLTGTLNQLKDQISTASDQAAGTLRNSLDPAEGAIAKSSVQQKILDLISNLQTSGSVVGKSRTSALGNLSSLYDQIESIPGEYISENATKSILKSLDENIDWTDKAASATNAALTNARGWLDGILKNGNPDYAQAMQPVSDKVGLLNNLKNAFSITQNTGEGLQPTDATIGKLMALPKEQKSVTQKLVGRLADQTGTDYLQASKNAGYGQQFQKGFPMGSARPFSFASIGAGLGSYFGGTPGAIAGEAVGSGLGLMANKYGGPLAGTIADLYSPVYRFVNGVNYPSLGQNAKALATYIASRYPARQ